MLKSFKYILLTLLIGCWVAAATAAPNAWVPDASTIPMDGKTPQDVVVGDWNHDGNPDLALIYGYGDEVRWYKGGGPGGFTLGGTQPVGIHPGDNHDDMPRRLWAADFDGDGYLDLAVLCSGVPKGDLSGRQFTTPSFGILYGTPAGGFEAFQPVAIWPADWTGTIPQFATALAVAETEDGGCEVAVGFTDSHQIAVLQHHGGRSWAPPVMMDVASLGSGPVDLALVDLDCRGQLDLVAVNYTNTQVWQGTGPGTFGTRTTVATGQTMISLALADFNQDGAWDLAIADGSANTIKVLMGLGSAGHFQNSAAVTAPAGSGLFRLLRLDVNLDGRDDLAALYLNTASGQIWTGQASATAPLTAGPPLQTASRPWALAAGDFNHDGWPDLAVVNAGDRNYQTGIEIPTSPDLSLIYNRTFANPTDSVSIRKDAGSSFKLSPWLTRPRGLGWEPGQHNLWTVDRDEQVIVCLDENGAVRGSSPLNKVFFAAQATDPTDIAVDDAGDLWLTDRLSGRLAHAEHSGGMLTAKPGFSTWVAGASPVTRPTGIAFDPSQQRLLVADELQPVIAAFSPTGSWLATYTITGGQPLRDLAWDVTNGCLWGVAESDPGALTKLTLDDQANSADAAGTIRIDDLAPVLQGQTIRSVAVDSNSALTTPTSRLWLLTDTGALVQATFDPKLVAIRELSFQRVNSPATFEPEGTILMAGVGPLATLTRLAPNQMSARPGVSPSFLIQETFALRTAADPPLHINGLARTAGLIFVLDAMQSKVFTFGLHGLPVGSIDLPSLQGQHAQGLYVDPVQQHLWIPAVGRLREYNLAGDLIEEHPLATTAPPSSIGRGPQYGELAVLSAQGGAITVMQPGAGTRMNPRQVLLQTMQLADPFRVLVAQPTVYITDPWRFVGAGSDEMFFFGTPPTPTNAAGAGWRMYR